MPDDMTQQTWIERAFEIAKSGAVTTLDDLRKQMKREQFVQFEVHLSSSPSLSRQLGALIKQSKLGRSPLS